MESIINAISQLWKLVAFIVLGAILFIYRDLIKSILLSRNLKIKKGDTEFEVNGSPVAKEEKTIAKEQTAVTTEKTHIENNTKDIDDSSTQLEKLFGAYSNRDKEELSKIIRDIESSELDVNEKIKDKACYYRMCHDLGDTEALDKLKELSDKHKESKEIYIIILKHLAGMYCEMNQFEKAFDIYIKAIDNCEDIKEKADLISQSALCALNLKLNEKAINIIIKAINADKNNKEALCIYYTNLATIYERLNKNELKVLALEKGLEYCSNNTNAIFDIAYTYDKVGHKDLTLLHYNNLLRFEPNNNAALNNKGVVCSNLGIKGLEIDSYKKAKNNGSSLACSNIAYEYIANGFYEEAKEILKEASNMKNPNTNVSKASIYLDEVIQSEGEKEKGIINKAIEKQRFFKKYAEAYFNICPNLNLANSNWKMGERVLVLKQVDNNVEGTWSEKDVNYKFEGAIFNKAFKAKLSKDSFDFITKTMQFKEVGTAYVYISNDNDKLHILLIENEKHIIDEFEKFIKEE